MTTRDALLSLPEEVLTAIVSLVSDSCLVNVSQVCRKLNRICSSPLEMRQRCIRFRWWDERHQIEEKKRISRVTAVDWRGLFLYRFRVELAAAHLLDQIIANPANHITKFNQIVDFGYDTKDCLKVHADVSDDQVDDPLARRYHATAAIRFIHRRRALSIWNRVREVGDVPLEVALLALDLFVATTPEPDIEDYLADIDGFATAFLAATPEFSGLDAEEKAVTLIRWMWEQGFRKTNAVQYRALKNVFVGLTIRTVRTAIPLTLVTIFCGIARRVGIIAYPCAYPRHVLAIVEDPTTGQHKHYDIFQGSSGDPRTDKARLMEHLAPEEFKALAPASVSSIVTRAAHNLVTSLQLVSMRRAEVNHGYPEICEHSALYGALTALVVLGITEPSMQIVEHMTRQIPADFPMDVRFLEEELLPRVSTSGRQLLENVCGALRADTLSPASRRDSPENKSVLVTPSTPRRIPPTKSPALYSTVWEPYSNTGDTASRVRYSAGRMSAARSKTRTRNGLARE